MSRLYVILISQTIQFVFLSCRTSQSFWIYGHPGVSSKYPGRSHASPNQVVIWYFENEKLYQHGLCVVWFYEERGIMFSNTSCTYRSRARWTAIIHDNQMLSALLAIYIGNPWVIGGFSSPRPKMQSLVISLIQARSSRSSMNQIWHVLGRSNAHEILQ